MATLEELVAEVEKKPKTFDEVVQEESKKSYALSEVPGQALKNIPSGMFDYIKTLVDPNTYKKLLESTKSLSPYVREKSGYFKRQAISPEESGIYKKMLSDRYGGWENIKRTIAEDPVGFITDISAVLTGGGGTIPKVGETISKIGQAIEPVNVAKRIISLPAKAIPGGVSSKLYQSAAKFSTKLTQTERDQLVKTAFKEGISPSVGGIDKARKIIDDLKTKIDGLVDQATATGQTMPLDDLFTHLNELRDKYSLSGKPMVSKKMIDNIENQIKQANELAGRQVLNPKQVQTLKQKIYRDLESSYETFKSVPAAIEAQQEIARAGKEYLESIIPEIKQLNAREGALIELNMAIERAAGRIKNRDLIGIGVPIKGITGGVVAGPSGVASGLTIGILDTPAVKGNIARVLERLRTKGIKVKPTATAIRLGIIEAERGLSTEK